MSSLGLNKVHFHNHLIVAYLQFFPINLLALWRQGPAILYLQLIVDMCGLNVINKISLMQRRHTPLPGSNGFAWLMILHSKPNPTLSSSSFQIYRERPEAFLGFLVLNEDLCLVHRSLNIFSVRPMYESTTRVGPPRPLWSRQPGTHNS